MSTTTSRLALHKPEDDGSEYVNVQTDLNQNLDKIDAAVGFGVVTSTTRPSSPYPGKPILESDTGRAYIHNGTVPASAGWVEIPTSDGEYDSDLTLAPGRSIALGDNSATAMVAVATPGANDDVLNLQVEGDTQPRLLMETSGAMAWGPGGSTNVDVALYRTSAATLTLSGNLLVTGIGQRLFATKTVSQFLASSTTLQNDDHLSLAVSANSTYTFDVLLFSSSDANSAGDLKVGFSFPSGAECHFAGSGPVTSLSSGTSSSAEMQARREATSGSSSISYGVSTTSVGIRLSGVLTTAGTGGTLRLMWAQDSSSSNVTWVSLGSYMVATRVA